MDTLVEVLLMGRDISRRFSELDPSFPRKTTLFKEFQKSELLAQHGYEIRIIDMPVSYGGSIIQGRFKNFTNSKGEKCAKIYYNADQNLCWRRFIYTKELCHLSNYGDEARRAATKDDVDNLLTKLLSGMSTVNLNSSNPVSSDYAAILIAIEILLPYSEKDRVDEMLKTQTKKKVAEFYLIPVQYLMLYCSIGYRDVMAKTYRLSP